MNISQSLIIWYNNNKRELPWRNTKDPFIIWLSEIILQQTRVDQGLSYFYTFVDNFNTIESLAAASEQEILKHWQGLGYYSRARNLHKTAKDIVEKYDGKFPDTYNELTRLKGIGDYTASAILSFSFNKTYPVLDGNVKRVISRLYNIQEAVNKPKTVRKLKAILEEIIDKKNPGIFNQAIMEFGALQCTPQKPDCQNCPLINKCEAFLNKTVDILPIKERKAKSINRFFYYLIIKKGSSILLNHRIENDIWKNLYDFPLIEKKKNTEFQELIKEVNNYIPNSEYNIEKVSKQFKHVLSHQNLFITFIHIRTSQFPKKLLTSYNIIEIDELKDYPVPIIIDKYLRTNELNVD